MITIKCSNNLYLQLWPLYNIKETKSLLRCRKLIANLWSLQRAMISKRFSIIILEQDQFMLKGLKDKQLNNKTWIYQLIIKRKIWIIHLIKLNSLRLLKVYILDILEALFHIRINIINLLRMKMKMMKKKMNLTMLMKPWCSNNRAQILVQIEKNWR